MRMKKVKFLKQLKTGKNVLCFSTPVKKQPDLSKSLFLGMRLNRKCVEEGVSSLAF